MELSEFLTQTQMQVRSQIDDRIATPGGPYPYPESVFAEVVMDHMADVGMTFDPRVCHYTTRVGNAQLKVSGFALSADGDQLDLFVSLYSGRDEVAAVTDAETKAAAEQCLRFLGKCAEGKLVKQMEESDEAYDLVVTLRDAYPGLDDVRIYVLTDRQAKSKSFKSREVSGKLVKLEVMDIERLHRHWSEGKPRDELVVNFEDICGGALPCVYVPGRTTDYDCVLTVLPGEALSFVYEKFGPRLLEANVRSFLSTTGKVNKGIRDTLRTDPGHFMAFNNGVVLVADEARLGTTPDGGPGLLWLKGMQIVNGGQTTASIYFTKRKDPGVDLSQVRVPAKIIILPSGGSPDEEKLIADISRCANTQNVVKQSDLSANKPFHVELEKLALATYCPDGVGRWFYERAAGSYLTMLAREGTTPARLRQLRTSIPPARKITKTELAKYLNAWDRRPDLVSYGSQKNFEHFMRRFEDGGLPAVPTPAFFKEAIAKAILYKKATMLVRPLFPAFQGNVATYLVAVLAERAGEQLDLGRIWTQQDISEGLRKLLIRWAAEVNAVLHSSANGRMISEWAKKAECWEVVRQASYSSAGAGVPEIR
jgi:hypothetical protein